MEIYPLGHASFKLKGKTATVVTDPYDQEMTGLKFPKHIIADIVTISHGHSDHNALKVLEKGESPAVVISGPGEYEVKGINVLGVPAFHDNKGGNERGNNTIYRLEVDGISIVHCGDLGHKLSEDQEAALGSIDVLLIPVGGFYTIDAKSAAEVVTALEPALVVPMHYARPELNQKIFSNLSPVAVFLKEMGQENVTSQAKLKVTKDSLPGETQVVVLE